MAMAWWPQRVRRWFPVGGYASLCGACYLQAAVILYILSFQVFHYPSIVINSLLNFTPIGVFEVKFFYHIYFHKYLFCIFQPVNANVLQLPEGGDFGALHCQSSTNFDRSTKLDLNTEPPLAGRCC
jgi:hypothetical protein